MLQQRRKTNALCAAQWRHIFDKCHILIVYAEREQPSWYGSCVSNPCHELFWPMLRLANHWG